MKKYIIAIILMVLTFMLGMSDVNAASENLELVDVQIQGKNATIDVDDLELNGNKVTSNITFNKVNDFVAFELTIKNNDDEEYKVISAEDNNTNNNIAISYIYDNNYIKKGETTKVTVKLKYVNDLTDKHRLGLNNLNIKINFAKPDGTTEELSINPTTGISILRYIILAIISLIGMILILAKNKKKAGITVLILSLIAVPFSTIANEKFAISLVFKDIDVMSEVNVNNYATLITGSSLNYKIESIGGEFRKATAAEYNLVKDALTEENVISTEESPKKAYMWETNTGTLYYSDAATIYMNEDSDGMFQEISYTSIDLSGLDSSRVTTMANMFRNCQNLEELDLSSFDTSNVTEMDYMFYGCNSLEEIDLSTFNTSNVTNMSYMFTEAYNLETIYVLDEWDTSNVTDYEEMFYDDGALVGGAGTIWYMEQMYYYDMDNLEYAHVDEGPSNPGFLTLKGNNKDFSILMQGDYSWADTHYELAADAKHFRKATTAEYNQVKDELTDNNNIAASYSPNPTYMWANGDYALYYSTASTIYTNKDAQYMFSSSPYETIDISGMDGSRTVSMYEFFYYSDYLKEIIFGDFDTSNVTNMSEMFKCCTSLEELDLSLLDTSNVDDMSYMFNYDTGLKELNLSSFDTSNVTNMSSMFEQCEELEELDLSSFDTTNVEYMYSMFYGCESLTTIYVSDTWDISNASDTSGMFIGAYNIIGEQLTAYDDEHTDGGYAHVDGGTNNPGYLTLQGHTKDFAILFGYNNNNGENEFNTKLSSMDTDGKEFRKATTAEYNSAKSSLTDDNVISIGSPKVYMWETDDSILYYSTVNTIYLNKDSRSMFEDTSLETIDISDFDTSIVIYTSNMFYDCENLATIYVSETWDISNVDNTENMFSNTYKLVGEKMTTYDENHTDGEYAHVDVGTNNPGYLTLKGHPKDFAIIVGYNNDNSENEFNTKLSSMDTDGKEFRKATAAEYNSAKTSLTDDNVISVGSPKVYMWETSESILYYSSVNTIYLNKDSRFMFKDTSLETIDISDFDASVVTYMSEMFRTCGRLATIYVSDSWDISSLSNDDTYDMFYGAYNIVGEQLTTYDYSHTDGEYAHVDGGENNPGYLTLKGHTRDFAMLVGYNAYEGDEFNNIIRSMNTTNKDFRKATAAEYNSAKSSLTNDDVVSTGLPKVYMWETNDSVLYYSTANTIYMHKNSYSMFYDTNFKAIDLSGFTTSNVVDMSYMFKDCENLIELDLSSFDTSNVADMSYMFEDCENLETIYVSNAWSLSSISNSEYMFSGAVSLVGEQGTTNNNDDNYGYIDIDCAHVDGGPSNPGYLTLKGHTKNFAVLITGESFNSKIASMTTANKEFRKATTTEYNSAKSSLTNSNIISTTKVSAYVYMWETNDSILYYSNVNTIYLNRNSSQMFSNTGLKTIDMSGFETALLYDASYMFEFSENLETIYVSDTWDVSDVEYTDFMFCDAFNIVGGQGTTYDEDYTDGAYAHIDGGQDNPGYLTDIADKE